MKSKEALEVLTELLDHWQNFKEHTCDSCIPDKQVEAVKYAIDTIKWEVELDELMEEVMESDDITDEDIDNIVKENENNGC